MSDQKKNVTHVPFRNADGLQVWIKGPMLPPLTHIEPTEPSEEDCHAYVEAAQVFDDMQKRMYKAIAKALDSNPNIFKKFAEELKKLPE